MCGIERLRFAPGLVLGGSIICANARWSERPAAPEWKEPSWHDTIPRVDLSQAQTSEKGQMDIGFNSLNGGCEDTVWHSSTVPPLKSPLLSVV